MKALAYPLAVASTLVFCGAAMAQSVIGDQFVPDESVGAVRQYCERLDAAGEDADIRAPRELTSGIRFEQVTLEDCRQGGFLTR